jgi:hypothetical protein
VTSFLNHSRVCWKPKISKNEIKRWLFEHGRMSAEELRSWLWNTVARRDGWPQWVRPAAQEPGAVPAVCAPEDVTIVVAGGDLETPQQAYFLRGVSRLVRW